MVHYRPRNAQNDWRDVCPPQLAIMHRNYYFSILSDVHFYVLSHDVINYDEQIVMMRYCNVNLLLTRSPSDCKRHLRRCCRIVHCKQFPRLRCAKLPKVLCMSRYSSVALSKERTAFLTFSLGKLIFTVIALYVSYQVYG